ncbi:molybdate ABC transporter ATP-binding protein ModF [Pasteurellaceae bacterium LIM206]|nr:molybdate ABC transporter ATP-binding protein ModF [Pasteurellaceae bacterium LIM206]
MARLILHEAEFRLHKNLRLSAPHFVIRQGDFWAVIGSNGSGKTAFSLALEGKLRLESGRYDNQFNKVSLLSFEKQQRILEATFKDRNNDTVSPDDFGKTARETILSGSDKQALCDFYARRLHIGALLERPFMQLSTGESRKVLLAQTLVNEPDLLILDEPFAGLDQQSVRDWLALLNELWHKMTLVLIVNRFSDIPSAATHLAVLDNRLLALADKREVVEARSVYQQLKYAERAVNVSLPESAAPLLRVAEDRPVFELRNVRVQYGDKVILDKLDWTVEPRQNWWIKGPNGAGKSTLLSLITGDHPQAFANHVILFGKQRGSGETVWDIKQKIGYVSSQLHMDYRINCSVLEVIVSGFFDSVGVYRRVPDALRIKAMQWLARLNMAALANKPFRSLSWGQQRLLLITRAMVKHPPVLILDEPLQGLDGMNRKLVKSFIEQLVNNSQTQLLFVSHQDQDAPNCISHLFEFIPQGEGYIYRQSAVS